MFNSQKNRFDAFLRIASLLAFVVFASASNADDDSSPCSKGATIDPSPDWVTYGGFLFLILLVIMMFWALALICEEFFVPALNIMCEEAKIPDDVAGATFMAAGASSPEMFTGFIGLLIYDSNIGVGTVVGSEIFNHMIITAGSVLFAEGGVLYLDARIVFRDLITYMLILLVLIWSLKGLHNDIANAFDMGTWHQCLDVSLLHSGMLILVYGAYAVVAGNYKRLTRMVCPRPTPEKVEEELVRQSMAHSKANASADARAAAASAGTTNPMVPNEAGAGGIRESEVARAASRASETGERPSMTARNSILRTYSPRASFRDGPRYQWQTDADREVPDYHERRSVLDEQAGIIQRRHPRRRTSAETGRRSSEFSRPSLARPSMTRASLASHNTQGGIDSVSGSAAPPRPTDGIELSESPGTSGERDVEGGGGEGGTDGKIGAGGPKGVDIGHYEDPALAAAAKFLDVKTTRRATTMPYTVSPFMNAIYDAMGTADPEDLNIVEEAEGVLKCYLNIYNDVLALDALPELYMWSRRYFTIDALGVHSTRYPDEDKTGPHVEIVDVTDATQVTVLDKSTFTFQVEFGAATAEEAAEKAGKRPVQLRAPNEEIMNLVLENLKEVLDRYKGLNEMEREMELSTARDVLWKEVMHGEEGHHGHSLLTVPRERLSQYWFYICFPLLFLFHYTLTDVREPKNRGKYMSVIAVCGLWLAALSYIMILCCDYLGDFIGATPTVMGLTLSAVGTSFPNLWSSMVVARQGLGSMAIGNALGSNIFNIAIALGCPWFVKGLIDGTSYREMPDHGIVMLVLLLEFVCVIWFAMIYLSGWRVFAWMAPIFCVIYVIVLAMSIVY